MKKAFRVSFIGLWVLVVSGLLARLWRTHSDVLPILPEPAWIWLENLYGVESIEDSVDLEIWVSFSFSIIVVLLFTLLGWFLLRRIKAPS